MPKSKGKVKDKLYNPQTTYSPCNPKRSRISMKDKINDYVLLDPSI